jgi:beta-1,3-galactosyltransferase 1
LALFTFLPNPFIYEKESRGEINENTLTRRSGRSLEEIFKVKLIPGLKDVINPQTTKYVINASYLLENKNLCASVDYVTILIFILSSPDNFSRRNVIRETWGNSSSYLMYGTVKVMFWLGKTKDHKAQKNIGEEFKRHGDILQGDLIDSYHNLSHKTVMGYKWLIKNCKNARYILKTDDDLFINIFRVFQTGVSNMAVNHFHVQCLLLKDYRIVRKNNDKMYIERNQLKGMIYQVPFCQGHYVLFLNAIVPSLYKAATNTPFFWVDDQFNYGLVMNQIPALKYKQTRISEYVEYKQFKKHMCWKKENQDCSFFVIRDLNEAETRDSWIYIKQVYSII